LLQPGAAPLPVGCWPPLRIDLWARDLVGEEQFTDLLPLCRPDHAHLHEVWDASPAWRQLGRAAASVGIIAALRRVRANPTTQGKFR